MTGLFLDTYAIHQLISGNTNYEKYKQGFSYLTTVMNLTELYYTLRRLNTSKETAANYFFRFSEFRVPVTPEAIIGAGEFKMAHKKQKLSYADCIGYITSKNLGVPFLTGDPQFEGFENVLFVK